MALDLSLQSRLAVAGVRSALADALACSCCVSSQLTVKCWPQVAVALGQAVFLWNASSGSVAEVAACQEGSDDHVTSVAWAADGKHLAVGTNASVVQVRLLSCLLLCSPDAQAIPRAGHFCAPVQLAVHQCSYCTVQRSAVRQQTKG